jgi:hypothetical protein
MNGRVPKTAEQCIFEESQRGRRRNAKTEAMQTSMQKMVTIGSVKLRVQYYIDDFLWLRFQEAKLNSVLQTMSKSNPAWLAAAAVGIDDSDTSTHNILPSPQIVSPALSAHPQNISPVPSTSFTKSTEDSSYSRPSSPRLHSLPDNTLNALGLLAESVLPQLSSYWYLAISYLFFRASLQNQGSKNRQAGKSITGLITETVGSSNSNADDAGEKRSRKLGVANRTYFQPSAMGSELKRSKTPTEKFLKIVCIVLPLRRQVIESRQPPTLLTEKILSADEVRDLFNMWVYQTTELDFVTDSSGNSYFDKLNHQ